MFGNNDDKMEKLGSKLDILKMENEVATQEAEIAQKKAIAKEMSAKYGKNWRNILKSGKDDQTLSQFSNLRFKMM